LAKLNAAVENASKVKLTVFAAAKNGWVQGFT
jgi:hypothetical protein